MAKARWIFFLLTLPFALPADAAPVETLELDYPRTVNIEYSGPQGPSSICIQPDGTTVVVWMDGDFVTTGRDGSGTSIQLRRLFPDGTLSPQLTVNEFTDDYQVDPQVACAADGDFVVVWGSGVDIDGPDGSSGTIAGRRYEADGTPKGEEFVVNSTALGYQGYPDVCGFPDGGFVAVWLDEDGYIYGRRFEASGLAAGDQFTVDLDSVEFSSDPAVGCAADGRFVAIWASEENDGDVLFQRFDATGAPAGSMTTANEDTDGEQGVYYSDLDDPADVAVAPDGRFVIAWTDFPWDSDSKVTARLFAADGTAESPSIEASYVEWPDYPFHYDVSVAITSDGQFGVTYNQYNGELPLSQIARPFRADGTPAGLPVRYGRGGSDSFSDYPTIAALSAGEFAVSWSLSIYGRDDAWKVHVNWIGGSMCGPQPASSCRLTPAGTSKLQARNSDNPGSDKIGWSWKKGAETLLGALGDPITGRSRYEFCLYDSSAAAQPLIDGLAGPSNASPFPPNWKGGTKGYQFSASYGGIDGYVSKMGIRSGESGRASAKAQVRRFEISQMLPFSGPVVAQLLVHGNDGIECWQSTFSTFAINDGSKVKAVGP